MRVGGFEPSISTSRKWRNTRLSYTHVNYTTKFTIICYTLPVNFNIIHSKLPSPLPSSMNRARREKYLILLITSEIYEFAPYYIDNTTLLRHSLCSCSAISCISGVGLFWHTNCLKIGEVWYGYNERDLYKK